MSFEPGDGSFEIILDKDAPIKPEWNVSGVMILRKMGSMYAVEKDPDEILPEYMLGKQG